jgi:predicted nucleic acid-binding protein
MIQADSDVLIRCLRGNRASREGLARVLDHEIVAISVITAFEVLIGTPPQREAEVATFLEAFERLPVTDEIATRAALLGRDAKRRNETYLMPDLPIGCTAAIHGIPLLTRNTKDFRHIPGIQLLEP